MEELRQLASRLVEESAREQAESLQAEEAAARHTAAEEQRAAAVLRHRAGMRRARKRACTGAESAFAQAAQQARAELARRGSRSASESR